MKKLFLVALFLLPIIAFGQSIIIQGPPYQLIKNRGGISIDSFFKVPVRPPTQWDTFGLYSDIIRQDSLLYWFNSADSSYHQIGSDADGLHWSDTLSNIATKTDLPWINVKSFGAKGDDSTDDSKSIEDAIVYADSIGGGTVYLPRGQYKITRKIGDLDLGNSLIITNSVKVVGEDGAVIDLQSEGQVAYIFGFMLNGALFEIDNLILDCNHKANRGIYLKNAADSSLISSYVTIKNCRIYDLYSDSNRILGNECAIIVYGQISDIVIEDNIIDSMTLGYGSTSLIAISAGGLSFVDQRIKIVGNTIKNLICDKTAGTSLNGIAIPTGMCNNLSVRNNTIYGIIDIGDSTTSNHTAIGISLRSVSNGVVANNKILTVKNKSIAGNALGIRSVGGHKILFLGNNIDSILSATTQGIGISDLGDTTQTNTYCSVQNNTISNVYSSNDADGIYVASILPGHIDISHNKVIDCGKSCIKVFSPNSTISDNILRLDVDINITSAIRLLSSNLKAYDNTFISSAGNVEHVFTMRGNDIELYNNTASVKTITTDWVTVGTTPSVSNIRIGNNILTSDSGNHAITFTNNVNDVHVEGNLFIGKLSGYIFAFDSSAGYATFVGNVYKGPPPTFGYLIKRIHPENGDTIIAINNNYTNSFNTITEPGSDLFTIEISNIINGILIKGSAGVTITGENYLSLSGQHITAYPINLSGSNVTDSLPVTKVSGLSTVAISGSYQDLTDTPTTKIYDSVNYYFNDTTSMRQGVSVKVDTSSGYNYTVFLTAKTASAVQNGVFYIDSMLVGDGLLKFDVVFSSIILPGSQYDILVVGIKEEE